MPDLEHDESPRGEVGPRLIEKAAHHVQPVGAAVERESRIVLHLGGQRLAVGHVGQVRHDEVKGAGRNEPVAALLRPPGAEEVAGVGAHARAEGRGVLQRQRERRRRDVRQHDLGLERCELQRECDAQHARAAAHVEHAQPAAARRALQDQRRELLRLGARNECSGIGAKLAAIKLRAAQQVLQRLAAASTAQQLAQHAELLLVHRVLIVQIQPRAVAAQHVREQTLHGEAGRIDAARAQVVRA